MLGCERVVTKVLMINRIKLDVVEKILHVWAFCYEPAIVTEQESDASDNSIEIGHVRHDVIGVHNVGSTPLRNKAFGDPQAEEFFDCWDAPLLCYGSNVAGGVNAKHRHTSIAIVLEEVAIIRSDLHCERIAS